jgi:DNA-binding transcriptional regulator YdaS (Cro superfamily)
MKLRRPREAGLTTAIKAAGTLHELGVMLGITAQAVSGWRRIPAERVLEIERVTGVTRSVLRPDLYPADDGKKEQGTFPLQAAE